MSDIADLLSELDIESWLDHEGIRHKRTRGTNGVQLNVRECPCCGNSNWKVYLNAETGAGNCFVCDEKFSKWKFIKEQLGTDGRATFQHVESYVKSQGWSPVHTKPVVAAKPLLILPESLPIPINGRNLSYLAKRGISVEIAEFFKLRYCHKGFFAYRDAYGRPAEQDYSKRVIIPIYDVDGRFVSFQGRDITGEAEKKYLFPPEYATTGSILFNLNNVKTCQNIVIGEGVFDCIAIKMALDGKKELSTVGPVASFGKRLADEQIAKLVALHKAGTLKRVILMWDAERKAVEAAVDAALALRSRGIKAEVALLPQGCDPNEVESAVVLDAIFNATPIDPLSAVKLKLSAVKLQA